MADGWQGKSRGGKTGHQIFIFLIRNLGVRSAYALLFFVVLYFIPFAPKSTGDIWRYARKILKYSPFRSALFVFRNYWAFGQAIIDRFAISSGLSGNYHFELENEDQLLEELKAGRGAVIICAHFGNWAAGEPFFREWKAKLNMVMYDNEYADIKEVIEKNQDASKGFKVIPVNKDNLMHVFMIAEALGRGELVCFMGDRYVKEEKLLLASLMGREVKFPSGPFLVSSRMKMPVYFYTAVRKRNMTYQFSFRKAETSVSVKNAEEQILAQFTGTLETYIRKYPEQWYNYYDFWGLRS